MDLHGYPQGEHGRFEQILNQFLLKSLHIILASRIPVNRPSCPSGEVKKSDKWFNLVLGNRPAAMDGLSFWNRSLRESMVIDIILVQGSQNGSSEHDLGTIFPSKMLTEKVVESWIVQFEYQRVMAPQTGDTSYKKMYKKYIILLRSVYSMLRLLPAYKAFRKLCSLNQNCDFDINYRVCSFSSSFSRSKEDSMKKYNFYPIDVQQGRLSLLVMYREDLSDFNLDAFVSCPPEIITDYVGSPLTDPMRASPSTSSEKGARATSFPIKSRQMPSSSPIQTPHSWTSGLHQNISSKQNQLFRGSPPLYRSPQEYSRSPSPSLSPSPSPSPSTSDIYSHRILNQKFPSYHKATSDDLLSPPFSSSPSPSPPTYFSSGNLVQSPLRSETAPMSIPHPMIGRSPRCLSPNLSDPNRHSLPPLSTRNTKHDPSSHESPSGIKLMRRSDLLRAEELSSGPVNLGRKVSRDPKEDSGRFSSLMSSSSSPRVGFSRSSSRLSFQDDFGDCDFSCPFIVDDVDPPDCAASQNLDDGNSLDVSSHASSTAKKSNDAAVGALVHMLQTAPPLRQDSSFYSSQYTKIELDVEVGAASEFLKPRKTSDALEELKAYKDMKELLLSKSAVRVVGKELRPIDIVLEG